ncbi:hypothetical protein F4774DRAFT_75619 [Daldinia eschscholtzii]|nr:hypothetical protein F4774DRAFT_75619 [Daldinia eschscholtzii]
MGTLHHIVHTGAKAISVPEFMDAVRATCTPRFPYSRGILHRRAAVAVSGGVDSMALAFLCSQLRRTDPDFRIADNPVSGFRAVIIDHSLREGSRDEAIAVAKAVKEMGLVDEVSTINWSKILAENQSLKDLTNFESVARTLRYRKLGAACASFNIVSLFLAHHEDDQYETILMRMLQGHGIRGLRGIRPAQDIPECEGLFGADKSGFVDDQARIFPFYNFKPTRKEREHMRRQLRGDISKMRAELESDDLAPFDLDGRDYDDPKDIPPFVPREPEIENGGITIYRPLLEFSKDRLIATCLENNVPWWEDATNANPTLTTRNAIRHLYRSYTLPKALQKPAILDLAKRCERKVERQEAEANRLLSRTIIHGPQLYAGTVIVQFPELKLPMAGRDSRSPLRRRARILKKRKIAAILMRKIILLVSPDPLPLLSTLENLVTPLFPYLALPEELPVATPPKAFSVSGVHLVPFKSTSSDSTPTGTAAHQQLNWYISRTPYPSTKPLPRIRTPYWASNRNKKGRWLMSEWMPWSLWDGRYWFRIKHRFPYRVLVLPYLLEHAKDFREQLPPRDQKLLASLLKRYAPGKVRSTLPAFYLEEPLDLLDMENSTPRAKYPMVEWDNNNNKEDPNGNDGEGVGEPRSMHPVVMDTSKLKLIALPTLGINHPGLDDWMAYETRYRKIDRNTIWTANKFDGGPFATPRDGALRRPRERSRCDGGRKGNGVRIYLLKRRRNRRRRSYVTSDYKITDS